MLTIINIAHFSPTLIYFRDKISSTQAVAVSSSLRTRFSTFSKPSSSILPPKSASLFYPISHSHAKVDAKWKWRRTRSLRKMKRPWSPRPTERLFARIAFDDSRKDMAANQQSYKIAGRDIERRPSYGN